MTEARALLQRPPLSDLIVLPVLGLIIWFLAGPKGKTRTA
jgi:hypothetical protein